MVHSPFQCAKVSFSQSVGDVFVLAWDVFQVVLGDFLAALFARVFIHVCGDMGLDVVDVLVASRIFFISFLVAMRICSPLDPLLPISMVCLISVRCVSASSVRV